MSHVYVFATIIFAVTSQLIIKWRMSLLGSLPAGFSRKAVFLFSALFDPYVVLSILLTFLGGLSWMAAMTRFEISYVYPFISLSFILILVLSAFFFNEPVTANKIIGLVFIVAGIIISSRSI